VAFCPIAAADPCRQERRSAVLRDARTESLWRVRRLALITVAKVGVVISPGIQYMATLFGMAGRCWFLTNLASARQNIDKQMELHILGLYAMAPQVVLRRNRVVELFAPRYRYGWRSRFVQDRPTRRLQASMGRWCTEMLDFAVLSHHELESRPDAGRRALANAPVLAVVSPASRSLLRCY
jgi:hypothetical protein